MPELSGRKLHLVKKALAIAVAAIERMPDGPFRSDSDIADIKDLLDEMIESDIELEHYARSARIAIIPISLPTISRRRLDEREK